MVGDPDSQVGGHRFNYVGVRDQGIGKVIIVIARGQHDT